MNRTTQDILLTGKVMGQFIVWPFTSQIENRIVVSSTARDGAGSFKRSKFNNIQKNFAPIRIVCDNLA